MFPFALMTLLAMQGADGAAWYQLPQNAKDAKQRLSDLDAAIAKQPKNPGLRFETAKILHFWHNDQKAALAHLKEASQLSPQHVPTWHLRALVESAMLESQAAIKSSLAACLADPDHPVAETAARRVMDLFWRVPRYNELVRPAFEELYGNRKLRSPALRDVVRRTLERIYEDVGDHAGRERLVADAGYLEDWLVVGPFGKFVVAAMATPYPPETEDQPSESYLRDQSMIGSGREKLVPKLDRFHNERVGSRGRTPDGAMYFVTYVHTAQPIDVIAHISSGYSLRLFVNRHVVLDCRRLPQWLPVVHYRGMKLPQGWSKIVVKAMCMYRTNPSFSLRLIRPDGTRAPVKVQAQFDAFPSVAKQTKASPNQARLGALDDLTAICAKQSRPPWPALMLAQLEDDRANTQFAKELFLDAHEALPEYALLCYALGDLLQKDQSLHSSVARSRSREWYRKALDLWPGGLAPLQRLAALDFQDRLPIEALKKLKKCVKARPDVPEWYETLFQIYKLKGWDREANEACQKVMTLLPDSPLGARASLLFWVNRGSYEQAEQAARKVVQHDRNSFLLAHRLENSRRVKETEAEYRRVAQWHPQNEDLISSTARVQRKLGLLTEAEASLKKLLDVQGPSRAAYQRLSQVQFARGDRGAAVQSMRLAFGEQPSSTLLHRALHFFGDQDPTEPFAIKYDEVVGDKANHDLPHPGVEAAFLLDQAVVVINPDGSSCERVHCIIKVYNKKGVERWAEVKLPAGAEIIELRTIKANGVVLEPEIIAQKSSYSMPGLSPGDVVEYEYLDIDGPSFFPGSYIGPTFSFKDEHAHMERSVYVAIVPKDWKLDVDARNSAPETVTSLLRGRRVYKWDVRASKESGTEQNSVPREEVLPSLRVSRHVTWEDVRDKMIDNVSGRLRVSHEIREVVESIASEQATPRARLQAAYDYVNSTVTGAISSTYFGQSASQVLSLRKGNRLMLLKALCDGLGIDSDIIRLAPRIGPEISKTCPDLYGSSFSIAVIRARLKGDAGPEEIWLDTAYRHLPMGYLLPAHRQARGVVLNLSAKKPLIQSPAQPKQMDRIVTTGDFELKFGGQVKASMRDEYHGLFAVASRIQYQRLQPAQRKHAYEKRVAQRFHGATLTSFDEKDVEDSPEPLIFEYKFNASRFSQRSGNRAAMRVGFLPLWPGRRYAATRTRRTPILVAAPTAVRSTIRIRMPAGVRVELPANVTKKTDFGEMEYTYRKDGRVFVAERRISIPIQRVPVKSYRDFAAFVRAIDQEDIREIMLKLDPAAIPKRADAGRGAGFGADA